MKRRFHKLPEQDHGKPERPAMHGKQIQHFWKERSCSNDNVGTERKAAST